MGGDEYHQSKLCQGAMSGAVPLMGLFIYIADGFAKQNSCSPLWWGWEPPPNSGHQEKSWMDNIQNQDWPFPAVGSAQTMMPTYRCRQPTCEAHHRHQEGPPELIPQPECGLIRLGRTLCEAPWKQCWEQLLPKTPQYLQTRKPFNSHVIGEYHFRHPGQTLLFSDTARISGVICPLDLSEETLAKDVLAFVIVFL